MPLLPHSFPTTVASREPVDYQGALCQCLRLWSDPPCHVPWRLTQVNQGIAAAKSSEAQRKSLRTNTIEGALQGLVSVLILLTGLS